VEATDILRRNKLVVKDVGVVVDREQGGLQQLEQLGIRLHSVFTLLGLIDFYRETGLVKPEMADEIRVSLAAA
ncbi:MAG: hypothetical protein NT039_01845, partial [Candidatus Berkelbacteria bacterium]|nr:hypothetical protein [Candidatus Berkelbacteria bacterium]